MKNKIFFTPGPSELYFTVFDHVKKAFSNQIPSISHRSIEFEKIYNTCIENLKVIFGLPNGYNIAFTSSANEIWERIIQNLIYDNSVHLINGSFSQKLYDFTKMYRVNSEGYFFNKEPYNIKNIKNDYQLISISLNETSTGIMCSDNTISQIRNKFNSGIIALDCTSGSPSIAFKAENVDTFYFSVQKCFGLPSGLGVWVYNEKCIKANEKKIELGEITGSYHSLQKLHQMSLKSQTPETPNILGIYLLMKVSEDIIRNGMNLLIKDTNYKSTLIYDTIKKHDLLECSIMNQEIQSKTVIVADTKISSQIFIDKLKAKNLIIGKGYGKNDNQIRIANFPTHSKESIELLCDEIKLIQ
tara:strand:+ start:318 stop:1388 length:1071 start_codon:yes stop_codon:yes gene_type:complete